MYPDFLGIGAQKAGTTWLYRTLQTHPGIWIPPRKELHYFDQRIKETDSHILRARLFGRSEEDEQWRQQLKTRIHRHYKDRRVKELAWELRYFLGKPTDGWYASLFQQGRGKVTGEITPSYSALGKDRIAHVYSLMPHAKLVFMIRNPIERVWSQGVMNLDKVQKGSATEADEEEMIRRFKRRDSKVLTNYQRTLRNWSEFYSQEQIFVGFTEDINFYPGMLMRRLYGFLGADPAADHNVIRKKVHSRSSDTMPTRIASHIARLYLDDIEELSERFGGYASFWAYCARNLSENPPEQESIEYPLYQSPLWQEWKAEYLGDEKSIIESKPQSASLPKIKLYP